MKSWDEILVDIVVYIVYIASILFFFFLLLLCMLYPPIIIILLPGPLIIFIIHIIQNETEVCRKNKIREKVIEENKKVIEKLEKLKKNKKERVNIYGNNIYIYGKGRYAVYKKIYGDIESQ